MTGAAPDMPTILLVDDEAEILVAFEDLLDGDYRVLTTTSPARALDMLAAEPDVAVIVSDQRMPEMPGHVFLARAREISSAETLLLTGYADIEAVISAVNEGRIGGYAHKPWEPEALRSMIAQAAERTRLRRQLAFEQQLFTALIERSPDLIGVIDMQGRVVRGDPEVAYQPGRAQDEAAIASGRVGDEELREIGADGQPRYRRVRRFPLEIEGATYLLKVISDESEQRLLQLRLQQSEKLQALGTLAGGIAHDFNNLLTAVHGNLELAAARAQDARLQRYIESATEAARRGTNLTKRLLSFTRQGEMTVETANPNGILLGMRELILRTTELDEVAFDLAPDVWSVHTDPEQLELAILNLAINARDAMPRGGGVAITTSNVTVTRGDPDLRAGDYVTIALADEGDGMTPEVAARVFEPFFTTKERGRGTGLGLPMVNAMAVNAGGRVTLETGAGQGTTVTIWLPRSDAEPASRQEAVAPEGIRVLRVLLAEDDPDVRAISEEYLRQLGHQVMSVRDGGEALDRVAAGEPFDLVMTDFAMPGLSGAEIAEAVLHRRPGTPVLIVTGFADVAALPAHVGTLRKPFTRNELETALCAALEQAHP
ncbi:response regulator [Sphingomonas sp.]|uniref:response regulator n=1 Tax=Sphingomonas sp. TaxID=28214 RepID=UPI000DB1BBAA|nr:response regulator [Sphingomonas sp.]PZU11616.1 MAG: hybrid sensor histidine kinase/response regulator [Sphingomonas sp.]